MYISIYIYIAENQKCTEMCHFQREKQFWRHFILILHYILVHILQFERNGIILVVIYDMCHNQAQKINTNLKLKHVIYDTNYEKPIFVQNTFGLYEQSDKRMQRNKGEYQQIYQQEYTRSQLCSRRAK